MRSVHDPLRYASAASRRAAEKTNAISSLQRAARRCAKHLGDGCAAALVDLVRAELGLSRPKPTARAPGVAP
jgi:hypothetical protein